MRDFQWIPPGLGSGSAHAEAGEEALDWGEREWGTHRYHIRRMLEQSLELVLPEKAAVLGAGNHGDVDLPDLCGKFQQVIVLDSEDNAIEDWAETAGGYVSSRLKSLKRAEYTGLDQTPYYETFEDLLLRQASGDEIAAFLRECAFQARRSEVLPQWKQSFSFVVSSGVHTQLFYVDALERFGAFAARYSETDIRKIAEALAYVRDSVIKDYNGLLVRLTKPDGRISMWTDVILLDEQRRWIAEELYRIEGEEKRRAFLFEAFGKYGMESAILGLKDLRDRLRPEQLQFHSWVWYTESGKVYIAAGLSGRPGL